MEVIYNKPIKNKQFLKLEDTQTQPEIKLSTNKSSIYSLIVHDPNADLGNKIHWARINIKNNNIDTGIDIIPYKGPAPKINTGMHHYIFELYLQDKINNNVKKIRKRYIEMDYFRDKLGLSNPMLTLQFKSKNTIG